MAELFGSAEPRFWLIGRTLFVPKKLVVSFTNSKWKSEDLDNFEGFIFTKIRILASEKWSKLKITKIKIRQFGMILYQNTKNNEIPSVFHLV